MEAEEKRRDKFDYLLANVAFQIYLFRILALGPIKYDDGTKEEIVPFEKFYPQWEDDADAGKKTAAPATPDFDRMGPEDAAGYVERVKAGWAKALGIDYQPQTTDGSRP